MPRRKTSSPKNKTCWPITTSCLPSWRATAIKTHHLFAMFLTVAALFLERRDLMKTSTSLQKIPSRRPLILACLLLTSSRRASKVLTRSTQLETQETLVKSWSGTCKETWSSYSSPDHLGTSHSTKELRLTIPQSSTCATWRSRSWLCQRVLTRPSNSSTQ